MKEVEYVIDVGFCNCDDANSFNELSPYRFVVVWDDEAICKIIKYVGDLHDFEKKFTEEESEPWEVIGKFLAKIDFGSEEELMMGTIQCAMEGDEDGLCDMIEDEGIEVNIEEDIPELDFSYDGRLYSIVWRFQEEQIDDLSAVSAEYIKTLVDSGKSCENFTVISGSL